MTQPDLELPKHAVLFDLNGTLLDMQVLMDQNKLLARNLLGIELTDERIRQCWGRPAEEFYPMLFGNSMPWQQLRAERQKYDAHIPHRLLPGAAEALGTLTRAGMQLGVITSGEQATVHQYMLQAELDLDAFALIYTKPEQEVAKANNEPIASMAIRQLGVTASRTLLVGDEPNNALDAQAAGIDYVLIAQGTRTSNELRQAGIPAGRILPHIQHLAAFLGIERA